LQREKSYEAGAAYTQSKTGVVLFTRELARRLAGTRVTVNCINPGLVHTQLGRDARGGLRVFLALMRPIMKSPEQAARDILYLATSPSQSRCAPLGSIKA
jgi:retinol dehydrogenase 14